MTELPGPTQDLDLDLVSQHASRSHEDNWLVMGNARERRKIQNRINQRARRSRQRKGAGAFTESHFGYVVVQGRGHPHPTIGSVEATLANFDRIVKAIRVFDLRSEENQALIRAFEAFCHRNYMVHAPIPELLPSLVRFNITRALISNAEVLGLSSGQLEDEAISPFHAVGPWPVSNRLDPDSLPAGLRPTSLQRATSHHPWFDLFPLPQMRDNLFRRGVDSIDEDDLCCALRGRGPYCNPGVFIWNDPWDASSWEVTEDFARSSWGWAIVGCWELYKSTNSWRAKRGEKPLFYCPDGV